MARVAALVVALLSLCLWTRAQGDPDNHTDPPPNWLADTISTDRTITFASPGPTYFVYGDITVLPGVTLTIEPGVTLNFAGDADFMVSGTHPNRAEILVEGALTALAPAGAPIQLLSSNPLQSWGGVTIAPGAFGHFRNVAFDRATTALRVASSVDIDSCAFTNVSEGIRTTSSPAVVTATQTSLNALSVAVVVGANNATISLSHCTVAGSTAVDASGDGTTVVLANCTLVDAGVRVQNGASLVAAASSIAGFSSGIYFAGIGQLGLTDVEISTSLCFDWALFAPSAQVDLRRVTVAARGNAVDLTSATGTVRELTLTHTGGACGFLESDGLRVGAGIVFAVDDSLAPVPSVVKDFDVGARTFGAVRLRNVLITNATNGVLRANGTLELDYCTVAGSHYGVSSGGIAKIYNSIINCVYAFSGGESVAYSDIWPLADGLSLSNGGQVASFDPGFVGSGPLPYKLAPTSLFVDFSVSGREIGAYGPGPGPPPANVENKSLATRPLRVTPNPSLDGRLSVAFTTLEGGDFLLEAFDLVGRRVWSKNLLGLVPGDHSALVGTALSKGVYWLRLTGAGQRVSRRFVVVG